MGACAIGNRVEPGFGTRQVRREALGDCCPPTSARVVDAPHDESRPLADGHWLGRSIRGRLPEARTGTFAISPPPGPTAWLTSYAVLPLFGVYKPIWQYDARTLTNELRANML